ncbi:DNA-3-methyladenine glucosyllase II [Sporothrix schenckii 1099-18]|uniref:DNA-3-methyladenine glucosyllase II n=1 Tax=Sporothrix schenckii 1099-18 TaxID=1397361 RepID=A0A0F2LX56_SPOSC|nr:DNA-3-methyladenine glucosyllase II [Sporothrix schenckii 1099-18]KJR81080.1 DNA-3-methyladenine glucosyllase II [Sporothrix schenckii 1099-18]
MASIGSIGSIRRSARLSTGSTSASPAPEPAKSVAKAKTGSTTASRKRKAVTASEAVAISKVVVTTVAAPVAAQEADVPTRPSTPPPPKKRRGRASAKYDPADRTTPSRPTTELAAPPATPKTPRPRHAAVNRLANPDITNAPLISPETSRIVSALPLDSLNTASAKQKTTTKNILEEACAHLISVDPRIKPVIDAHYCKVFSPESLAEKVDPFESLASGIISQQVSGAAARAIKNRFVDLFEKAKDQTFPHPSQVAVQSIESLRSAGLSQRKAEYLKGLAEKFVSGELSAQLLADAPYDTLVERLVAVRGLGLWSVEMFAMFGLKRMDVFSVGDLGVQRGMAAFAGRDIVKLKKAGSTASKKNAKWKYMTDKEMVAMAEPFKPYRSVFMWYMWQVESVDVSTMG